MMIFFLLKTDSKLCDICVSITTIKKYIYLHKRKKETIHCYVEQTHARETGVTAKSLNLNPVLHKHTHKQDNDDARGSDYERDFEKRNRTKPTYKKKKNKPYGSLNYLSKASDCIRTEEGAETRKNLLFYKKAKLG